MNESTGCTGYSDWQEGRALSRRTALGLLAVGLGGWASTRLGWSQAAFGAPKDDAPVLLVLFLRGGADGLNMVIPYREDAYHRSRPTLALGPPSKSMAADLDGQFALHPSLAAMLPAFREGELAIIHAVGSHDQTRSHFEAMNTVERGAERPGVGPGGGWLARHLEAGADSASPLRSIALSSTLPDSLVGSPASLAIEDMSHFRLDAGEAQMQFLAALDSAYQGSSGLAMAGSNTLKVLKTLQRNPVSSYKPSPNAAYPGSGLGEALKQIAFLIRARVGLEVACLDLGGWDSHFGQGQTSGWMPMLMTELAEAVAAFRRDMGAEMRRVCLVVQTEFGRRVTENASLGTDHGRAGAMFVMGGAVQGGRVLTDWPGLDPDALEPPGDLRVTTDYRDVLTEILERHMGSDRVSEVFPGLKRRAVGLYA